MKAQFAHSIPQIIELYGFVDTITWKTQMNSIHLINLGEVSLRMRVVMIPSIVGGPNSAGAVHFRSICKALGSIADVTAIAQEEHEIESCCKIIESKISKPLRCHRLLAWFGQLTSVSLLQFRTLLKSKPDCVYVRFGANAIVCTLVCAVLGIPAVVEFNGLLNLEALDSRFLEPFGQIEHFRGVVAAFMLFLERLVARAAEGLVCVSSLVASELVRRHNLVGRVHVIENGVDCKVFAPTHRIEARKRLGLPLGIPVMVYVGSFILWQGLVTLIEASKLVVLEHPDSVFLLVGDGPLREPLVKAVQSIGLQNNFIFTGEVMHREIPEYISSSDICLAPFTRARNEATGLSPLKIFEYMACGRAVITTKVAGVSELVTESKAGLVVPPDNPLKFAEGILYLLEHRDCRESYERNARLAALKRDWSSLSKGLLSFMQLVVSEGKT
jgi:glycosyltransferase involved in cell wall biosynthesis